MIALLGAGGKIGQRIYKYLRTMDPDLMIKRGSRSIKGKEGLWEEVDITSEESIEGFLKDVDLVINAAGPSELTSPSVMKAAIKTKIKLIDLGSCDCYEKENDSKENRIIYGCGSVPGVSGMLPLILAKEYEEVKDLHVNYLINEKLSYSAAYDMAQKLNPGASKATVSKTESIPFLGNQVYRYNYFDKETQYVDKALNVGYSEWAMVRQSDDLEKVLSEDCSCKEELAQRLVRLGEVNMMWKEEEICFVAELTGIKQGDIKTDTCFIKVLQPSALSGACAAATALELLKDMEYSGIGLPAEYKKYPEIWDRIEKLNIFDSKCIYPYSLSGCDEECGEL